MKKIIDLNPAEEFYFENDRETIYTFINHVCNKSGRKKYGRAVLTGKLYPLYFSVKKDVIVLNKYINQ